ncbi:MAG: hypothetical protein AAGD10_14620 [Myxococcota bacterium]
MNTSPHIAETIRTLLAADHPPLEKAESFVEMAFDLQKKPKALQDLVDALALYDQALALAGDDALARARALAGKGGALRRLPGTDGSALEDARACFDEALTVLRQVGEDEEVAEVEMSLGLVLQALAAQGSAPLQQAVQAYHRALQTFTKEVHPREFATIHNNLATAYLSMKLAPEREVMREAMAVQSFQEALKVVSLIEDPTEYAMLQNNLGNALQAMRTSHPLENLSRAVEAYDEALKVRTRRDTPVEYANTVTNKANALMNLPDDPERSDLGNPRNLASAVELLRDAQSIYLAHEVGDRAEIVGALSDELVRELAELGMPA